MVVGTGDEQETFSVHQDIICDRSEFFKAACSKNWLENQEKTVRLPEQEVETFRLYLESVYAENVDYTILCDFPCEVHTGISELGNEDKFRCREALTKLCRLWVTADFLRDPKLQNDIIDCVAYVLRTNPSVEMVSWNIIRFVTSNIPVQAGLHRLFIGFWGMHLPGRTSEHHIAKKILETLPAESMTQLLTWLLRHRTAVSNDFLLPERVVDYYV